MALHRIPQLKQPFNASKIPFAQENNRLDPNILHFMLSLIHISNRGAQITAINTRRLRFTKLAIVNIGISPAPLNTPSVIIFRPINTKNHPIKRR